MRRALILALALSLTLAAWAKTVWVVGENAPIDANTVARDLSQMLGDDVRVLRAGPSLAAWANTPDAPRSEALRADTLLVALAPAEAPGLAIHGLRALAQARARDNRTAPLLVSLQRPVYKMTGLCDEDALRRDCRLADTTGCAFAAPPKSWQRVYTDDTFYNDRVPKGPRSEAYIQAAAITLALRGEDTPLPPLSGIHPDVAEDLIDSIRDGFDKVEDIHAFAAKLPHPALPIRTGNAFEAVLHDGDFEHAIGAWLQRLAKADGRDLTLHYTAQPDLSTGLPCLFRTFPARTGTTPNALLYTRPPFADDTAREELLHLAAIFKADAAKPNWLPFPLAVAEFTRLMPHEKVYHGAKPTSPTAAMFAAMVYLRWTGAAVLPADCTEPEARAIQIGLDTILTSATLDAAPNATLCQPLGEGRYAFSLLRAPRGRTLTLTIAAQDDTEHPLRELEFTDKTFFAPQTITAPQGATLLWKAWPTLPGQLTGARVVR